MKTITSREVDRAYQLADILHSGQFRKNRIKTPYILHPQKVATTIERFVVNYTLDSLCVALLHDVLEDCITSERTLPYVKRLILEATNGAVLASVEELTDDPSLSWKQRREQQLIRASSFEYPTSLIVKLADKACNLLDIYTDLPLGWTPKNAVRYAEHTDNILSVIGDVPTSLDALHTYCSVQSGFVMSKYS